VGPRVERTHNPKKRQEREYKKNVPWDGVQLREKQMMKWKRESWDREKNGYIFCGTLKTLMDTKRFQRGEETGLENSRR